MRGLVISPEYRINNDGSFQLSYSMGENKLKQYLMYWDKLDFPNSNLVYISNSPEMEYLIEVGVMQRSMFSFGNSFTSDPNIMYNFFSKMQIETYLNNNKEKGSWSLAQPNRELIINKDHSELTRTIEVNLYESLPIPSPDTSLDDILIFKERRKDELLDFRSSMDNFYLELIKSGDSERAMKSYIENIQRKIIAIDRVMNESKISKFRGSTKIRFDLGEAIKNTFFGAVGAASIFNFSSASGVGAALGFASSFIKVNTEMSLKPKGIPNELKDYAYLYYAEKELN